MRYSLLTTMAVVTFGILSNGFAVSVQAQTPVFPGASPGDGSGIGDRVRPIHSVLVPDQGTVVLGGLVEIMASPDVYAWFIPAGGSILVQSADAGQMVIGFGTGLAWLIEDDITGNALSQLASGRPVNDADNRPPGIWFDLTELVLR